MVRAKFDADNNQSSMPPRGGIRGNDKRGIGDLNVVVTFAGVTFRPGEYVYADNNGVIVSPSPLKMPE